MQGMARTECRQRFAAVHRVTRDRVTNGGQMCANLVAKGAADYQLEQRPITCDALQSIARDLVPGVAGQLSLSEYAHALRVRGIGCERA